MKRTIHSSKTVVVKLEGQPRWAGRDETERFEHELASNPGRLIRPGTIA